MATAVDELTEEDESKFTSLDLDLDSNNIDNMPKRDGRKGKKANCLLQSSGKYQEKFKRTFLDFTDLGHSTEMGQIFEKIKSIE